MGGVFILPRIGSDVVSIQDLIKNAKTVDLSPELSLDERLDIEMKGKIAAAILEKRYELNMNQEEFSKYVGLPTEEINQYEEGEYELTVGVLRKISSKILGV